MKIVQKLFFNCLCISLLGVIVISCQEQKAMTHVLPERILVKGDKFIDNKGRQVILNGVNVVSKNKEEGYIFQSGSKLYENLKKWGVNCIRFIIIWDRLEPEPGVFNQAYLEEIDQCIDWAGQNNIFVVLDMHQDLFSVKYADGAPKWATLDEGKQHSTGTIWSDAYMLSEAVQTAFDNFWNNKSAPDGIGLQDHYAALWQHIAKRYANNKTVIGYDIMNEPFPGTSAVQSTKVLLTAYGQLYFKLTGEILTEKQLEYMWGGQASRTKALQLLSNQDNYHFVINQMVDLNKTFEIEYLQKMYQKVSHAIREVDQNSIIFLEHSYYGNMGVASSIERVFLANGSPDTQVAYAPHGYDLVTDTDAVASASNERVAYIYEQIKQKGKQLNMPVWLGEWGAFYGNSNSVLPVAKNAIGLIEQHLMSNAYWSYNYGTEDLNYFKNVLIRCYPVAVNGTLTNYRNDFDQNTFTMRWDEDASNNPSIIFVPKLSKLSKSSLDAIKNVKINHIQESDAGWLVIPPNKNYKTRSITLEFMEESK